MTLRDAIGRLLLPVALVLLTCGYGFAQNPVLLQNDIGVVNVLTSTPHTRTGATLANADAAPGNAAKTLFLSAGAWTISSSITLARPLWIPQGATITLAAGQTLALLSCPRIEAKSSWLTVGDATSKVLITAPGCSIYPHQWATSGDGTTGSKWAGWDTVIDWSQFTATYLFTRGNYSFSTGFTISGSRVRVLGEGMVTTSLTYTGTGSAITLDAAAHANLGEMELGNFYVTCTDGAANKTVFTINNTSRSYYHDIWVQTCNGGGTTGVLIQGRDTSTFARILLDADRPLRFHTNPVAGITDYSADTTTFVDMELKGVTTPGYACVTVDDKSTINRIRFTGYQSWEKCANGFYWNDTTSTDLSLGGILIEHVGWEQNTDPTGWFIFIKHNVGVQELVIRDVFGGNGANGIYLRCIQGIPVLDHVLWLGNGSTGSTSGTPLNVDASACANIMSGLDIRNSTLGGDSTFNPGGLDPCTGGGGSPTGSHACLVGLRQMFSIKARYGDMGDTAFYINSAGTSATPVVHIMEQPFSFPTGATPPTVTSNSGHLASLGSVVPFLTTLDCPTGLSPCSGTFKMATLTVVVAGTTDQTIRAMAIMKILPFTDTVFPAVVVCLTCDAQISAGIGAVQFWVYHDVNHPPTGFFTFVNGFATPVDWFATLTVGY
jgi:uncharacterized protein YdbL (DUF1318 family)